MIGEINQGNLHLLLPSKVSWLASMLVEYKGLSIVEAIKKVYASNLYKKLKIESTKTWHLGPVALYQELESELTWTFLYTLYITHYQAIYVLKIVRVCFDKLKKKALPLQLI